MDQSPSASASSDLSTGDVGIKDFVGHAFAYGDYEGVVATAEEARPVWTDARNTDSEGTDIYVGRIRAADIE